jgi:hypothetical protein
MALFAGSFTGENVWKIPAHDFVGIGERRLGVPLGASAGGNRRSVQWSGLARVAGQQLSRAGQCRQGAGTRTANHCRSRIGSDPGQAEQTKKLKERPGRCYLQQHKAVA